MHFFLLCILISYSVLLPAQPPFHASFVKKDGQFVRSDEGTTGTTRAVVIGISNYQDPAIPDLQFAHRDAEAFAEFLQSPSGGNLQDDQIQLLTNEKATHGAVVMGIYWLRKESEEGDKAIFYFSGHGDVEQDDVHQLGWFLCYDTPPQMYMAGGVQVATLKAQVDNISIGKKAKTMVVTDACRAGKMAGSVIGGTRLTNEQILEQFKNQSLILSCQPDEYSLEGEQWGGGRGVFSFHLVNGLYGMADADENQEVRLLEVKRYLEDNVPAETAPHQQIPVVEGNMETLLSVVDRETVQEITDTETPPMLTKARERSLPFPFDNVDTTIQELYLAFEAAVENGKLLSAPPGEVSANDYYARLIQEESISDLHALMTRNFSVALQDEAQQALNAYIRSERHAVEFMRQTNQLGFLKYPAYLERSAELLGKDHFIYNDLKAKEYFFRARGLMIESYLGRNTLSPAVLQRLFCEYCEEGLRYDPEAAYLHAMLGHGQCDRQTIEHYQKALEISPAWLQGHIWLAEEWEKQQDLEKAVETIGQLLYRDSTYVLGYKKLSQLEVLKGAYHDAIRSGETALSLDSTVIDPWYNDWLPAAYVLTHQYGKFRDYRGRQASELQARESIETTIDRDQYLIDLANYHFEATDLEKATELYTQARNTSNRPDVQARAHWGLGWIALINNRLEEAASSFSQISGTQGNAGLGLTRWFQNQQAPADSLLLAAIRNNPTSSRLSLPVNVSIAQETNTVLAIAPGLAEGIERIYELATREYPDDRALLYHFGHLYFDIFRKNKKAIRKLEAAIAADDSYLPAYVSMARVYASSGKYGKALNWLEQAFEREFEDREMIETEADFEKLRGKKGYGVLIGKYFDR